MAATVSNRLTVLIRVDSQATAGQGERLCPRREEGCGWVRPGRGLGDETIKLDVCPATAGLLEEDVGEMVSWIESSGIADI